MALADTRTSLRRQDRPGRPGTRRTPSSQRTQAGYFEIATPDSARWFAFQTSARFLAAQQVQLSSKYGPGMGRQEGPQRRSSCRGWLPAVASIRSNCSMGILRSLFRQANCQQGSVTVGVTPRQLTLSHGGRVVRNFRKETSVEPGRNPEKMQPTECTRVPFKLSSFGSSG